MAATRTPAKFFQPLAVGAPAPFLEKPVRLERMIHFVAPHVEKIRAKIPELIAKVDVICGNLEDAIPIDAKDAARALALVEAGTSEAEAPRSRRAARLRRKLEKASADTSGALFRARG